MVYIEIGKEIFERNQTHRLNVGVLRLICSIAKDNNYESFRYIMNANLFEDYATFEGELFDKPKVGLLPKPKAPLKGYYFLHSYN